MINDSRRATACKIDFKSGLKGVIACHGDSFPGLTYDDVSSMSPEDTFDLMNYENELVVINKFDPVILALTYLTRTQ